MVFGHSRTIISLTSQHLIVNIFLDTLDLTIIMMTVLIMGHFFLEAGKKGFDISNIKIMV